MLIGLTDWCRVRNKSTISNGIIENSASIKRWNNSLRSNCKRFVTMESVFESNALKNITTKLRRCHYIRCESSFSFYYKRAESAWENRFTCYWWSVNVILNWTISRTSCQKGLSTKWLIYRKLNTYVYLVTSPYQKTLAFKRNSELEHTRRRIRRQTCSPSHVMTAYREIRVNTLWAHFC